MTFKLRYKNEKELALQRMGEEISRQRNKHRKTLKKGKAQLLREAKRRLVGVWDEVGQTRRYPGIQGLVGQSKDDENNALRKHLG